MLNENVALREEIERSSMFEEIVGSLKPCVTYLAQCRSRADGIPHAHPRRDGLEGLIAPRYP